MEYVRLFWSSDVSAKCAPLHWAVWCTIIWISHFNTIEMGGEAPYHGLNSRQTLFLSLSLCKPNWDDDVFIISIKVFHHIQNAFKWAIGGVDTETLRLGRGTQKERCTIMKMGVAKILSKWVCESISVCSLVKLHNDFRKSKRTFSPHDIWNYPKTFQIACD